MRPLPTKARAALRGTAKAVLKAAAAFTPTSHFLWVLDVLTRFAIIERFDELRQTPIILPKGITRAQYQSLALLGIDRKRIVEFEGSHWQVSSGPSPAPSRRRSARARSISTINQSYKRPRAPDPRAGRSLNVGPTSF